MSARDPGAAALVGRGAAPLDCTGTPDAGVCGPAAGDALDNDLGWALGAVLRSYLHIAGAAVGDLPAGHRGYQILAAAVRDQPRPQAVLAQQLGLDRTVMTYLVDDLVSAGVIERLADPADRRVRRIGATAAGRGLLCEVDARLRAAEDVVLSALSPEDAATFRALLRRLACASAGPAPATDPCTALSEVAGELSRSS